MIVLELHTEARADLDSWCANINDLMSNYVKNLILETGITIDSMKIENSVQELPVPTPRMQHPIVKISVPVKFGVECELSESCDATWESAASLINESVDAGYSLMMNLSRRLNGRQRPFQRSRVQDPKNKNRVIVDFVVEVQLDQRVSDVELAMIADCKLRFADEFARSHSMVPAGIRGLVTVTGDVHRDYGHAAARLLVSYDVAFKDEIDNPLLGYKMIADAEQRLCVVKQSLAAQIPGVLICAVGKPQIVKIDGPERSPVYTINVKAALKIKKGQNDEHP